MAIQSQPNPEETKNSYYIVFFYQDNPSSCIYALTSGDAWKVVRAYLDYSFPIKIIEEVGNPNKIMQIARRALFGNHEQKISLRRAEYELYKTSHLYFFCESFKCEITHDSKLFELIKMKNRNKYVINVTTGGLLKILQRIRIEDFPPILDLFSQYIDGAQNQAGFKFEFLHFLRIANLQRELDKSLIGHIYCKYRTDKDLPIVHIRREKLDDFLESNSFKIKINGFDQETKSKPPTIEEITVKIAEETENEDDFRETFLKSELTFKKQTSKRWEKWQKIIDCIEAEYRYSGKTYFKIRKLWYELMPYHLTLLEEDFKKVINNILIKEESKWRLNRPWTGNCKGLGLNETYYNRLYQDDDRCIVLDEICPDNIECCDILKYTNDEVYLYQVKEKFGQNTRVACSQILTAAKSIKSAIALHQSPTYLEKLWDMVTTVPKKSKSKEAADWRKALKNRVEAVGKDVFLDIFLKRKIVFVYAYLPSTSSNSFSNILNRSRNVENKNEPLMNKLKEVGYLDTYGRKTGKFLSTTKEKFHITGESAETSTQIYDRLKSSVLSKSTSGKIELVRLLKSIQKMGFDLKVCEIEKIPLEPLPGGSQTQTTRKIRQPKLTQFSPSKSQNSTSVPRICKNKKINKVNRTPEKGTQTKINDFFKSSPMKKLKLEENSDM